MGETVNNKKTIVKELIDKGKQKGMLSEQEIEDALSELENKSYTFEYKYVEMFGTEDYIYTLNKGDELQSRMDQIYSEFATWLGSWEM